MQDNEKIKFENYPLIFDGCLMGFDTETKGFEYLYEVLPYFVTTEKLTNRNDWGALGRLLDSNCEEYKKPNEFLKFLYNAFYPIHIQLVSHEPRHDSTNVLTLESVTNYVINWLSEKMDSKAMKKDLIICEMYATLRPQPPYQAEVKGFDLCLDDTQLETLHGELIGKFLDSNTKLEHFKNAFNGKVLAEGFKPLKWSVPTMGAVFFFHVKKTEKPQWTKYSYLFEPANYKKLLSQSKGIGTFDYLTTILEKLFYRPL